MHGFDRDLCNGCMFKDAAPVGLGQKKGRTLPKIFALGASYTALVRLN